jgi:death-on-curing protein
MKLLNVQQIIMMHELLIKETGGISGLRDEGLLESAVSAPFQTFDGMYIYKTIESKAARLGYGMEKIIPLLTVTNESGYFPCWFFLNSMEFS